MTPMGLRSTRLPDFSLNPPHEKATLTPMVSNHNPEIRMSRHRKFLDANWRAIASFAQENYLAKGKGIVAVPEEDFVHANEPTLAPIRFHYFPESEVLNLMSDYEGSKEQGWMASYDPEEKAIVTIIRFDHGFSSYLIGTKPSQPECHKAAKAKEG